jgi:hypothetical protein
VWGFKSDSQGVTLAKEISYKADILGQILVQHNNLTPTHYHLRFVFYSSSRKTDKELEAILSNELLNTLRFTHWRLASPFTLPRGLTCQQI